MIKKFIKFMIIGASGTIVNLIIFSGMIYFNFTNFLAATIAFIFAATNNFFWNFKWTFKGEAAHKSTRRKYFQFFTISLVNFGVNIIFLHVFDKMLKFDFLNNYGISLVSAEKLKTIFAQGLAIGVASILNFVGNYLITFKGEKNV